ncbi:hypothetical protein RBG61_13190 [Paludicola sp. MB14-C6]|nr:hypothetical protein [Paludicola sp. MB14-C6]WMJ22928.1 hypothetical protein RBG61_13190 [Paludicola sp. MB14-C6]
MAKGIQVVCKNTYKNKDSKLLKQAFNKKWIELINQYEKSKMNLTI